jgi:hypothetical protein
MDTPPNPLNLQLVFDTHIGHYVIAAACVISFLVWMFSPHNTALRKLAAIGFGCAISLAVVVVMGHLFFPAGPMTPGTLP